MVESRSLTTDEIMRLSNKREEYLFMKTIEDLLSIPIDEKTQKTMSNAMKKLITMKDKNVGENIFPERDNPTPTKHINLECSECHSLIATLSYYNNSEFKKILGDVVCGVCKLEKEFDINKITINCVIGKSKDNEKEKEKEKEKEDATWKRYTRNAEKEKKRRYNNR